MQLTRDCRRGSAIAMVSQRRSGNQLGGKPIRDGRALPVVAISLCSDGLVDKGCLR